MTAADEQSSSAANAPPASSSASTPEPTHGLASDATLVLHRLVNGESSAANELLPFMRYVDRCTMPEQRLLVMGFMPEVSVLTKRAFAGGQSTFIPGWRRSASSANRGPLRLGMTTSVTMSWISPR